MLKFLGKPWELNGFLLYLEQEYGKNATIKEICEKVGN